MKRPINFDTPRGVKPGKHLNLTRSLADIWQEREPEDIAIHVEIERRAAAGLPFPTYDELLATLKRTEPAA